MNLHVILDWFLYNDIIKIDIREIIEVNSTYEIINLEDK